MMAAQNLRQRNDLRPFLAMLLVEGQARQGSLLQPEVHIIWESLQP